MKNCGCLAQAIFSLGIAFSSLALEAAEQVTIKTDFPGGNVAIQNIDGSTARLAPDLRTTKKWWFYWYFEAEAAQPGKITFEMLPNTIASQGPAYSEDGGKTWKWLGANRVAYAKSKAQLKAEGLPEDPQYDTFSFDFTKAGQKVRFSMGFPYTQSNLDEFLKKYEGNPNLKKSVLATTLGGRPVDLLQIGNPGPGVIAMVVAARSHACEALASYILQGFLQEALSDSPAGVGFREKYVLFAVPILDKDGVEEGDQGKNREPHDHNRDYGIGMYPEIKALQELAVKQHVQVGIDFHCPALKGDIHEAFHWLGLKVPHSADNVADLSGWIGQERPAATNTPISVLAAPTDPPKTEGVPFSWHFSYLDNSLLAVTLESPYAQVDDVETAILYGQSVLRALMRTELITAEAGSTRPNGGFVAFEAFLKEMNALIASNPAEVEAKAKAISDNPASLPVYRAQAHLVLATMYLRQKEYAKAAQNAQAAAAIVNATSNQQITALTLNIAVHARNPDSSATDMEAAISAFEAYPTPGKPGRYSAYTDMSSYYERLKDYPKALEFAEKAAANAPREKSPSLIREARILDLMGKQEEAAAVRKELVAFLRPLFLPVTKSRSIMVGVNAGEWFDAVMAIPTSTQDEKIETSVAVLNYPTLPADVRTRVTKWMQENAPDRIPVLPAPTPTPTKS